ncbi:MarR family transcriptional regulator [Ectobacillus sp. JY-23]|uniref:MarR family winged helix-turn-helix transcriptional regulator n=1 Tax=Ectobacillus sp. JY-23 TaxID=2933872 RepID=UPI001FF2A09D|nr:MarR family transcriptional regulator [Ectobacillus sp. JY-23]UOY91870.1 MarR family transcriptional regulator [Ectobacillus sp. JY-23]
MDNHSYLQRIHTALHVMFQKLQPQMQASIQEHRITPTQLFVIGFLKKKGSCKISELAEEMGVKPSAVTFMVDRLEQNELVMREHDTKDRRVVNIRLTAQGNHTFQQVLEARKAIINRYFSHLDETDLATIAAIYEKLVHLMMEEE